MSKIKGTRFTQIPEWVLDADISDRAIRLYGVLARIVATERQDLPGRPQVAERMKCSPSSLDRALKELEDLRAVVVLPRWSPEGDRIGNDYELRFDEPGPEVGVSPRVNTRVPTGEYTSTHRWGDGVPTGGEARKDNGSTKERTTDRRDPPTPSEPTPALELVPPPLAASAAESDFARFWQVYPAKRKRLEALRAWPKAVKAVGGDVQRLIDGAQRYRDDPNRSPGYTCNPASWLNAGSWDDEPLPSKLANGTNGSRPIHRPLDTDRTGPSGRTIL